MTDKDLPNLTHKQFRFVQGILEGKTASDAYRAVYDVSGFTDAMIWVEASRTKALPNVSLWLSKARTEALNSVVLTKEAYIQELMNDRQECKITGNLGAAVKALELAGKVMGHYVDQTRDLTDPDKAESVRQSLASMIARIETANPQLALLLKASQEDKEDNIPVSH